MRMRGKDDAPARKKVAFWVSEGLSEHKSKGSQRHNSQWVEMSNIGLTTKYSFRDTLLDHSCLNKKAFRWSVVLFRKKKKGAHNKKKRAAIIHVQYECDPALLPGGSGILPHYTYSTSVRQVSFPHFAVLGPGIAINQQNASYNQGGAPQHPPSYRNVRF